MHRLFSLCWSVRKLTQTEKDFGYSSQRILVKAETHMHFELAYYAIFYLDPSM